MERGLANKKVPKPQFSMPIIWVSLQKEGGGEAYEMFDERYIKWHQRIFALDQA